MSQTPKVIAIVAIVFGGGCGGLEYRPDHGRGTPHPDIAAKEEWLAIERSGTQRECAERFVERSCQLVRGFMERHEGTVYAQVARATLERAKHQRDVATGEVEWQAHERNRLRCEELGDEWGCKAVAGWLEKYPSSPHALEARALLGRGRAHPNPQADCARMVQALDAASAVTSVPGASAAGLREYAVASEGVARRMAGLELGSARLVELRDAYVALVEQLAVDARATADAVAAKHRQEEARGRDKLQAFRARHADVLADVNVHCTAAAQGLSGGPETTKKTAPASPATPAAPVAKPTPVPPSSSSGRLRCCDGTLSPSCTCGGSRRGCCSRHGGVCGCD